MKDRKPEATGPAPARRPYQKPAFQSSIAFERTSLACGEPKNAEAGPPGFCSRAS